MPKGGKQPGAGAPFHLLHLDDETARILRILALNRLSFSGSHVSPQKMAQQIVAEWAAKEYAVYEAEILRGADLALLGEQEERCESSR